MNTCSAAPWPHTHIPEETQDSIYGGAPLYCEDLEESMVGVAAPHHHHHHPQNGAYGGIPEILDA